MFGKEKENYTFKIPNNKPQNTKLLIYTKINEHIFIHTCIKYLYNFIYMNKTHNIFTNLNLKKKKHPYFIYIIHTTNITYPHLYTLPLHGNSLIV